MRVARLPFSLVLSALARAGNRQRRLIERNGSNVGGGQFVDEAVAVFVNIRAEAQSPGPS